MFGLSKENGFLGTETVTKNRSINCFAEGNKAMKETERCAYSCTFNFNLEILMVMRNDNYAVTGITKSCGVPPLIQVKRYSRKKK